MRRVARPTENKEEIPGGDSFLDITANIVGILVLLVVVVGVRAGQQVLIPDNVATVDTKAIEEKTQRIAKQLHQERLEIERMAEQAAISNQEAKLRNLARADLAKYNATLKQEVENERNGLSKNDRRTYEIGNQLAQARLKLEDLTREQITLTSNTDDQSEAEPIYFDPTPIIRERVTDEIMLRLQDDKLVYLPLDELQDELKNNFPNIRNDLSSQTSDNAMVERRVGPIQGFTLRTIFQRERIATNNGIMQRSGLLVARLEEQGESRAEPIESLNDPYSRLSAQLAQVEPAKTVVTLIVFPDSYDTLPAYETALRERGFRVAKNLQKAGKPIEFSPTGRTTRLQ